MKKSLLISGVFFLLIAWASPLPSFSQHSFYGHMIMHMLVVAVAAPLLSLGIVGTRFDPTFNHPLLFAPIPAAVGELIIVWGWHAPMPHHFARHTSSGIFLEQGMFLLAGVWVWVSSFGGRFKANRGAGVIGLLLTSMHMTFLGALLSLSIRPFYNHQHGGSGLSVLEDQHLGGAIMLIVGGISYLSGGLYLTLKMLKDKTGGVNEKLA
jgi:putative membrane protein